MSPTSPWSSIHHNVWLAIQTGSWKYAKECVAWQEQTRTGILNLNWLLIQTSNQIHCLVLVSLDRKSPHLLIYYSIPLQSKWMPLRFQRTHQLAIKQIIVIIKSQIPLLYTYPKRNVPIFSFHFIKKKKKKFYATKRSNSSPSNRWSQFFPTLQNQRLKIKPNWFFYFAFNTLPVRWQISAYSELKKKKRKRVHSQKKILKQLYLKRTFSTKFQKDTQRTWNIYLTFKHSNDSDLRFSFLIIIICIKITCS